MAVTVYKSTDASAPTLRGVAGDFVALLDAILVNGYGSKAAQGWTKPYSGTNAASYRMPAGTSQRYFDVQDSAVGSASYARGAMYEAMTALATGTGAFPTAAQFSGGLYFLKSNTADTTARPWWAYGNGKILYVFISLDSGATQPLTFFFALGDFSSYTPSDAYATVLIGGPATTMGSNTTLYSGNTYSAAMAGHYVCRAYTGIGSSASCSKFTNSTLAGQTSMGNFGSSNFPLPYPNGPDSGLYMERVWLSESNSIRGELPGIWAPLHNNPLALLDTFDGTGVLAGKSFEVIRYAASTGGNGQVFMEVSNTW